MLFECGATPIVLVSIPVNECRACAAGECSHAVRCPMMIRWYDDPWDGTFWLRCECTDAIVGDTFPVTVRRAPDREAPT